MLTKLALTLAALAALAAAPAAAGDGPMFVSTLGTGIVSGTTRFVPIVGSKGAATELAAISTSDGTVQRQLDLAGSWGLPAINATAQGLSLDGRRLVLASTTSGLQAPSRFLVVDTKTLRVVQRVTLNGTFSFDALSPDASRMYIIQYTRAASGDISRYIVRAYDLRTSRLLPGRIADRTQKSWIMQGYPVTRTTSADGRWVYTLYQNPGGYPFVHALDTMRGVAHCVGLPLQSQRGIYNLVLLLHGRTLSVHWRSGRPFVNVDTTSWRVTPAHRGGFDRWWAILALPPLLAAGAAVAVRRRRPSAAEPALALREPEPAGR